MGAIRDFTGSFSIAFVIGGISFIASALMHFIIMWINHQENVKTKKTKSKTEAATSPSAFDV